MDTRRADEEQPRALSLRRGRLTDGMAIGASIRARLFGLRLLHLDADVTILPASSRSGGTVRGPRGRPSASRPSTANGNGRIGAGLADATRVLEASASELDEARETMPAGANRSADRG